MSSSRTFKVIRGIVSRDPKVATALLDACASATNSTEKSGAEEALRSFFGSSAAALRFRRDLGDEFQSRRSQLPRVASRLSNKIINECVELVRERVDAGKTDGLKRSLGLVSPSAFSPLFPTRKQRQSLNEELGILLRRPVRVELKQPPSEPTILIRLTTDEWPANSRDENVASARRDLDALLPILPGGHPLRQFPITLRAK